MNAKACWQASVLILRGTLFQFARVGDELREILATYADDVHDAHVRKDPLSGPFVDGRSADAEVPSDLTDCQQMFERAGDRGGMNAL